MSAVSRAAAIGENPASSSKGLKYRNQTGESTFEVQHLLLDDPRRCPVAQALARRIVVRLPDQRKPLIRHLPQIRPPRQEPPQPADRVLHSPLLPRRVRVAEERLDAQPVKLVVTGELGPIVEGHRLAKLRRQRPQHPGDGLRDRPRLLRRRPREEQEARGAFLQGQLHRVRLPVPEGPPVGRRCRPLSNGSAEGNEGNRASPPAAPPPPLPLRPRQVAPPIMVLVPRGLGVDEPVDALVRGHRPAFLSAHLMGDLLRRPPPLQARQDPLPQLLVPFQPRPRPAPRAGTLLGRRRLVPVRSQRVPLQLPSHGRCRAIQSCSDLPDRGALGA